MFIRSFAPITRLGFIFAAGLANALFVKATLALNALSDPPKGITLNVGVISGGQTVNTIAPWAKGEVDLRFITPAQRDATLAKVEEIMARSYVPGTSASIEIAGEFVPLV